MPAPKTTVAEIDGHRLKLSNLDKVLYPVTGTTKGEVIDYYVRIAPAMLNHIAGRGVTLRRFPDGVDGPSFFEKRCASHRPAFVTTLLGPGDRDGDIKYCNLDSVAALAWAANMAALEIHAPMARENIDEPHMCVFDLDPGAPAAIRECAEVGLDIRTVLADLGLEVYAKTSGSKGLQLYVPLNTDGHTHEQCSAFAQAVAQAMEKHHPKRVTSVMRKDLRGGKVFIDWSQNSRHKTTVAAYSLRAREQPTVSTPVSWDEVEAAAGGEPLSFTYDQVLDRVERDGDLFAPTATLQQRLPG